MGNLQAMLQQDPSVAHKVSIVAMAGSVYKCYGNVSGACPEYNVDENIPAAQAVFTSPWPITITPLDTCGLVVIGGSLYASLLKGNTSSNIILQTLLENYSYWSKNGGGGNPAVASSTLYDTVAMYLTWSNRAFVDMKEVNLVIEKNGAMSINNTVGKPVNAALTWSNSGAGLTSYDQSVVSSLLT